MLDFREFLVGADRDGDQVLEHIQCGEHVDAQNWTVAQLVAWALAHCCPKVERPGRQ